MKLSFQKRNKNPPGATECQQNVVSLLKARSCGTLLVTTLGLCSNRKPTESIIVLVLARLSVPAARIICVKKQRGHCTRLYILEPTTFP